MPKHALHVLTAIAFLFAAYSFLHIRIKPANPGLRLMIIAVGNLLYCCVTIGLLVYYSKQLTLFGWSYFVLELAVLLLLVFYEFKTVQKQMS